MENTRQEKFFLWMHDRGYYTTFGNVYVFDENDHFKLKKWASRLATFRRWKHWFLHQFIKQVLCRHGNGWIQNGAGHKDVTREEAKRWITIYPHDKREIFPMIRLNWTCPRCGKFDYRIIPYGWVNKEQPPQREIVPSPPRQVETLVRQLPSFDFVEGERVDMGEDGDYIERDAVLKMLRGQSA